MPGSRTIKSPALEKYTRFGIWKSQIVFIDNFGKIHGTTTYVGDDCVIFLTQQEVDKFRIKTEEL